MLEGKALVGENVVHVLSLFLPSLLSRVDFLSTAQVQVHRWYRSLMHPSQHLKIAAIAS